MVRAALALHEATGESHYLERALAWQGALDRHYPNPDNGGYFLTADDAEGLVVRPSATTDDATPNANALAAQNLIRLAVFTGQQAWRERADRLFDGILASAGDNVFAHLALLNALDLRLRAAEIVVAGEGAEALLLAPSADCLFSIASCWARSAASLAATHPAHEKVKAARGAAAFVCIGDSCSLPLTDAAAVAEAVAPASRRSQ